LLLSLLENTADPIPVLSSAVLTTMISTSLAANSKAWDSVKDTLPKLYRYLSAVSKSQDHLQDLAMQSYTSLLRTPYARATFWEMKEETVNPLFGILKSAAGGNGGGASGASGIVQGGVPLQLLYHVLLVIWQMTFDEVISEEITAKYDLIRSIADVLRNSIKEKVARVSLAILSNLITKAPQINLPLLFVANILPYLQTLSTRYTAESDPDLTQDLSALVDSLEAFESEQTTLSSYRIEVMSGHLRWSPMHRNEGFWKRHAREILDDAKLVKQIASLVRSSTDKTVLAVACNDIGVLLREVSYTRKRWEDLGVKTRVMELMGDSDAEVKYEALKTVQGFLQAAFT